MAKIQNKIDKNLTVDYKKLLSMPVGMRNDMAQSSLGQSLLSALTPQQYAALFPTYYKEAKPDISGFTAASRGGTTLSGGGGDAGSRTPTASIARKGRDDTSAPWMKKLEAENPELKGLTDKTSKATLTDDQKKTFDALKQGKISADDPRVAFLKNMDEEQLKKAGIQKTVKEDGKIEFGMTATAASQMSDEDAIKGIKAEQGSMSSRQKAFLEVITRGESQISGVAPENVSYGMQGGGKSQFITAEKKFGKPLSELTLNEVFELQKELRTQTKTKGQGVSDSGSVLGTSAVGRGQWVEGTLKSMLKAQGIKEEDFGNIKFSKDLQDKLILTTAIKKRGLDPEKIEEWINDPKALAKLGDEWESLSTKRGKVSTQELQSRLAVIAGQKAGDFPPGGEPTPEQIAAYKQKQIDSELEQRGSNLAAAANSKLPEGVDPKFAKQFEDMSSGQKQKMLAGINKFGVEEFNKKYKDNPESVVSGNIMQTSDHVMRGGFIQSKDAGMNRGGSEECATLSKAFNKDAGLSSSWKDRVKVDNSRIKPGVMVATTAYNDGSGGKRGQNYHTGIALTAPDADGNFKILEQWKGKPARIGTYNVNSGYKGTPYGVVDGADKQSMTALQVAAEIASRDGDKELAGKLDSTVQTMQAQIQQDQQAAKQFAEGNTGAAAQVGGVPANQLVTPDAGPSVPSDTTVMKGSKKSAEELKQTSQSQGLVQPDQGQTGQNNTTVMKPAAKPELNVQKTSQSSEPTKSVGEIKIGDVVVARNGQVIEEALKDPRVIQAKKDMVASGKPNPVENLAEQAKQAYDQESKASAQNVQQQQVSQNAQPAPPPPADQKSTSENAQPAPKPVQTASAEKLSENAKPSTAITADRENTDTQTARPIETAKPVPVAADGGTIKTIDEKIEAYPIGALKGDNTVIVDTDKKPLFTMNTNNELATFNPKTQNVTVTPQHEVKQVSHKVTPNGAKIPVLAEGGSVDLNNVPKTNPDELAATETSGEPVMDKSESQQDMSQQNISMMTSTPSSGASVDAWQKQVQNLTDNPIQSASFGRAMAATKFQKGSDNLGGHFDMGSYTLK